MEVRKQDQARPEVRVFGRLRFLHLDDQIGLTPNLGGIEQDFRACVHVFAVGDGTAGARLRFHQHAMAGFTQRGYAARNQPDARFVIFNFFGDANYHWGGAGGATVGVLGAAA